MGVTLMNLDRPFDFTGKVAVVIGGSGVLCGALAQALGQQGAAVVVVGHSQMDRAQGVADQIVRAGGQAIALATDVLDRQSLEDLAKRTLETFGQVDICSIKIDWFGKDTWFGEACEVG